MTSEPKAGTPLSALKYLSRNAKAALLRDAGVETLEEAVALKDEELLALRGLKKASLLRLRAWEADPSAPERPPLKEGVDEAERETRLWSIYAARVIQGALPGAALKAAWEAVEQFEARCRQEEVDRG